MTIATPAHAAPAHPPDETHKYAEKVYRVHQWHLVFPPLDGPLFLELVHDIRKHGLRRPIIVMGPNEDVIVDGRNRMRAALQAGAELRFEVLPLGANPVDALCWEILRYVTASQRAMTAARLRRGECGDWTVITDGLDMVRLQNLMAAKAGVSPRIPAQRRARGGGRSRTR